MERFAAWLEAKLGHKPVNPGLFERALTHASQSEDNYERLEFLGDRVLGLTIADWLYGRFPDEPEGKLSRRLNELVSRETCAAIARQHPWRRGRESDRRALAGRRAGGRAPLHPRRLGRPRRQRRQGPQAPQVGASGMGRGQQSQAAGL